MASTDNLLTTARPLITGEVGDGAPEIEINNLRFVVGGTAGTPDTFQPYVIILVDGKTNTGAITSNFKIQTMVTQREYDI